MDKLKRDRIKPTRLDCRQEIQDFNRTPVFIGGDVNALYPSMNQVASAELAFEAVLRSDVEYTGIDYRFLLVYLTLVLGETELKKMGLAHVIPWKKEKDESNSLMVKKNRDMNGWIFNLEQLSERDKRYLVASMIKTAVITMSRTTCYSFGGSLYLQCAGAGIGLRGSACLAKICMGIWDQAWAEIMLSWGIKCKIYMRYIDDIRIYAYPIKPGWSWSVTGWTFDPNHSETECDIRNTCDEFCKTFNSIMDFLDFTAENECDFETGYLPTLDTQTKVLHNGIVRYKFFSKPMKNNLVIENGSALPRNIVFGSLRQEIVRRLQNTSSEAEHETKLQVIEDMIQLMVNSKHSFSFIKSVVLQGITKFKYMEWRASLPEQHPRFMPLHRTYSFRRNERILTKFVEKMTWFKVEKMTDPYKNSWRRRVKFKWTRVADRIKKIQSTKQMRRNRAKGLETVLSKKSHNDRVGKESEKVTCSNNGVGEESEKVACSNDRVGKDLEFDGVSRLDKPVHDRTRRANVTTTLFVPSSFRSLLFKLINERERLLSKNIDWSVKILEQAGTPLLTKFIYKFPIEAGCPKGEMCCLCSNDTVKCSVKGGVYRAHCVDCQMLITGDKGFVEKMNIPTYIGETSRPARERIYEHIKNLRGWSPDSIIIQHWMENHGTEVVCPRFKFDLLGAYSDPLRRQLTEAIYISEQGTLNNKHEFGVNELYQLQCTESSRDQEAQINLELERRKFSRAKLQNFIDVMSSACNDKNIGNINNSRLRKRPFGNDKTSLKRIRIMDTSTPKHFGDYRNNELIPDTISPTSPITGNTTQGTENDHSDMADNNRNARNATNLSGNIDGTRLTPIKPISESAEDKKLAGGAQDLSNANKRSSSLPNLSWENIDNCMFNKYPTRNKEFIVRSRAHSVGSVDGVDYGAWRSSDFSTESNKVNEVLEPELDKVDAPTEHSLTESEKVKVHNSVVGDGNDSVVRIGISDGSPVLRRAKRILSTSPSTPIGLQRKFQTSEMQRELKVVTFGEDVEMLDLQHEVGPSVIDNNPFKETPDMKIDLRKTDNNRKFIKGLRRRHGSLSSTMPPTPGFTGLKAPGHNVKSPEQDETKQQLESKEQSTKDGNFQAKGKNTNITIKGLSVKKLRHRNKKKTGDYKATRKKGRSQTEHDQRLILEYYTRTPKNTKNNIAVAGSSTDGGSQGQ